MKYRRLGKTAIEVSEISLGCWTMGGLNWVNGKSAGWANVDENEISEAINYAIDNGVTHFDNADVYGNGRAERMLARIIGKRTKDFISTVRGRNNVSSSSITKPNFFTICFRPFNYWFSDK